MGSVEMTWRVRGCLDIQPERGIDDKKEPAGLARSVSDASFGAALCVVE